MERAPSDVLCVIASNITSSRDYKSMIETCKYWNATLNTPEKVHPYMDVMSTIIMQNPHLKWRPKILEHANVDVIANYTKNRNWLHNECNYISQNACLTRDFIIVNKSRLNHYELFSSSAMTTDLIPEFINSSQFEYLQGHKCFTLKMMKKYRTRLNWVAVSRNSNITEEFIDDNIHLINWKSLSENRALTISMIEKYNSHIHEELTNPIDINEAYINKHINLLNWSSLSPRLSLDLIRKFEHKVNWYMVFVLNPNMTIKFIREFHEKHKYIISYPQKSIVTEDVLYEFGRFICYDSLIDVIVTPQIALKYHGKFAESLFLNKSLPIAFWRKNMELLRGLWYD
jgi:hypothetical protein